MRLQSKLRLFAFAAALASTAAFAAASAQPARDKALPAAKAASPSPPSALARLLPSADGMTIHDSLLKVTWLANGNLAATQKFGISGINPSGSMDYQTALKWVAAMNAARYLGHSDWTLPTTPAVDKGCTSHKNNDFGFGCTLSGMGSLYTTALGLHWPASVVAASKATVGPFKNLQPNLYWTDEKSGSDANGYGTFSFNNGIQGSNVDRNYFYVLPMIPGKLPGTPVASGKGLEVSADGQTVYDPVADVTWLADADLALTQKFGVPAAESDGTPNFSPTGGMTHTAALAWIKGMNAGKGYLGHTNWALPPITPPGAKDRCAISAGTDCSGNPLGELLFAQLHVAPGQSATVMPDIKTGLFHNLQPYLYWSCEGDAGKTTCSTSNPNPAPGFGASFNLGDGFQGSDVEANSLFVMVYYPD